jgi:hypothetical protein
MQSCQDASARTKILSDLLDLLDSNPSNIESLMVLIINYLRSFDINFSLIVKMIISGLWLELLA